jgi:hypothetical protein
MGMTLRFTIDGSDLLENRLAKTCEQVLARIRKIVPDDKLEALLLGGGYGRGQGGVLKTEWGDEPYNDLEFYVCLRGSRFLNEKKFGSALHHMAEELTPAAGLEVEFKITSVQDLQGSTTTMFFYDLVTGHRLLWGSRNIFEQCDHLRDPERIPLAEATRLLMNRCSGLLYAEERLRRETFGAAEADFVGRNHAKAELAFGDVLLTVHGQYHWNCRERHQRLLKLAPKEPIPRLIEIQTAHARGVEFKLHPHKSQGSRQMFLERQKHLRSLGKKLWLWLESRRLRRKFSDNRDYALSEINKCPETSEARNRLVNAKTFGPIFLIKPESSRYPRERLLNSLALLLWEPEVLQDQVLLEKVQNELRSAQTDFSGLVGDYEKLWRRFN